MEEATDIGVGGVLEAVGAGAGSDQGHHGGVAVQWRRWRRRLSTHAFYFVLRFLFVVSDWSSPLHLHFITPRFAS